MLSFHNRCRQVDRLLTASKKSELVTIMHGLPDLRNHALQQKSTKYSISQAQRQKYRVSH
jgi:hypothetical protein